jgi:hypothetical protein
MPQRRLGRVEFVIFDLLLRGKKKGENSWFYIVRNGPKAGSGRAK